MLQICFRMFHNVPISQIIPFSKEYLSSPGVFGSSCIFVRKIEASCVCVYRYSEIINSDLDLILFVV
jgi:hypothetical protein